MFQLVPGEDRAHDVLSATAVLDCDALDRALLRDHVEEAPVGDARDGEPRNARKRLGVVEGAGEQVARLGEKRRTVACALLGPVQACVVDRERRAARDLFRERQVSLVVRARRFRPGEGQRAERAVVRDERHGDRGMRSEREHDLVVTVVVRRLAQLRRRERREVHGGAAFEREPRRLP